MSVRALWLPHEVTDVPAATTFYTDHLGLSIVDGWHRGEERGVVLKVADASFLELTSPGAGAPATIAFELADRTAVDAAHQRFAGSAPRVFPRGHYGFDAPSPIGAVMVWSER
jgi:catechol 2,3-dioxygenase-like lactoylglutathione lyase family enzyme